MTLPDGVIEYYVSLFAAREDVYSHWTPDGWRPVREPLTKDVAVAGLTGNGPSISSYLIAPGSKSHVFAVDFDGIDGYSQAITLGVSMWASDMPVYVETSRRGAHLWGCLDEVIPAATIRKGLRACLATALLPYDDPKVELRPGSDTIEDDGLGHALRMPFMPHPKTGKRGRFLVPTTEEPLAKTLKGLVERIDIVSSVALSALAARWSPPRKPGDIPHHVRTPRKYDNTDYGTASEILRNLWGAANAVPGKAIRCPAHEDKMPSLSILKDDQRAICFSPSCILHNDGHGRGTYELTKMAPHGT